MRNLFLIAAALLISFGAFAKAQKVDDINSMVMLNRLIAESGKLKASEFEHEKVVKKTEVSALLALAIQTQMKMQNSCEIDSGKITCVLKVSDRDYVSEIIYVGEIKKEGGAKIKNVHMNTF